MRVTATNVTVGLLLSAIALGACTKVDEPADGVVAPSTSVAPEPTPTLAAPLERFVGEDASDAYFRLRELGYRVRFAAEITRPERLNVIGIRTHPEVNITNMVSQGRVVTILDVECYGGNVC